MFTRIVRIIAALIAVALSTGCASYSEVTTTKDGVRTEKKFSGWAGGVGSSYNPYYGGQMVYHPGNRTLNIQDSGARDPVMVKRYDAQGNLIQMYPTCGGGRAPIAGKC